MPAISVVIPVYNAAPFLREALDSLLAQTCGDFEAIAVNDGSTDNSLEILQEYAARDSRIRILDGPNGGYGKAMNRGMDAATGKYMAILEPDDFLPREAYAILLPLAEEHQLDVVRGTHCTFFEEAGARKFQYVVPLRRPGEVFCPRSELPGVFEFGPHIWTGLYSLSFLRNHGIRFHESPGASYQDTGFFFLTAAYAERYMLSDEVAYIYRTDNPNSSINTLGEKRYVLLKEYEHIKEALNRTPDVWDALKKQFADNRFTGILWICSRIPREEIPAFIAELKQRLSDWTEQEAPLAYRQQFKALLAGGAAEGEGQTSPLVVERCLFGGLVRVRMSAQETSCCVMGVPLVSRRRMQVARGFKSGIVAQSDYVKEFCVLGIPLARVPLPRYAEWPDSPCVVATCPVK